MIRWPYILALGLLLAGPAPAEAPERSARPDPRPDPRPAAAEALVTSLRPEPRTLHHAPAADFASWRAGFEARARAVGITQETLDQALSGVAPDPEIARLDARQSEFSRTLWDYLDRAVSQTRIRDGRAALQRQIDALAEIEATFGVEAEILTAIWGLESTYGTAPGNTPVIPALVTLAHDGRRQALFEAQLIAALELVQSGAVDPARLRGSWAGAMGHTQFMPESLRDYAVDGDGDGQVDIWGENPVDALASAAHYLAEHGWTQGQPWGMEVQLPQGFDLSLTGERIKREGRDWSGLGVRLMDGSAVPDHGPASILLPAGARGVVLVIYDNFHVLETYNTADAYVIAVGHLADRILGGSGFQAGWPRDDRALSFSERQELQTRLQTLGFAPGRVDGIVGPNTIEAVRRYQQSTGLVPDGYASLALLDRLR